MSERSQRRAMERATAEKRRDVRVFFLSMQAKGFKKRFSLASRLLFRTDLAAQAKKDGLSFKDLRRRGLIE